MERGGETEGGEGGGERDSEREGGREASKEGRGVRGKKSGEQRATGVSK